MNHPLAICQLHYHKSWGTKSINCVGVQMFKPSELKITNIRMLKFHIRLCSICDKARQDHTKTCLAITLLFA